MKKSLLLSAVLATVLFAGNASAISGEVNVKVSNTQVKNKTQGTIWVTFNTFVSKCVGGCDYTRIAKGDKKSTWGSFTGNLLNVYVYQDGKEYVEKGYRCKTDAVEISVENGKIVITEVGK